MSNIYRSEYEIWAAQDAARYIYTHRDSAHFPMDSAVAEFNKQKQEGFAIMQQRYRENYINSFNHDLSVGEGAKLLNLAMSEDEAMNKLDNTLTNTLNKNFSDGIKNVNGFSLEQSLQKSYKSLNDCIRKNDVRALNTLLQEIEKAAKLLQSSGNELVILLQKFSPIEGMGDVEKLYGELKNAVSRLEGKKIGVPNQQLYRVAKELQKLTGGLLGGAGLSSLSRYVTDIFSTDLGEYVVSRSVIREAGDAVEEINKTLTGSSHLKLDDVTRQVLAQRGSKSTTYKTDNSFSNITIELTDNMGSVNLTLGLSTKWYKNINSSGGVSIGKETSFMNRINQLCDSVYKRYLAYNSLAAIRQGNDAGYLALKGAILARNLDVLISGLGIQNDFAQFIVVNGDFYSIWQIIQAVQKQAGDSSGTRGSGNDIVTISAEGLSKIDALSAQQENVKNSMVKAYARAKAQDSFFNSSVGLHGRFYPHRLTALVG